MKVDEIGGTVVNDAEVSGLQNAKGPPDISVRRAFSQLLREKPLCVREGGLEPPRPYGH
jgi:hypothetical protein